MFLYTFESSGSKSGWSHKKISHKIEAYPLRDQVPVYLTASFKKSTFCEKSVFGRIDVSQCGQNSEKPLKEGGGWRSRTGGSGLFGLNTRDN